MLTVSLHEGLDWVVELLWVAMHVYNDNEETRHGYTDVT